MSAATAPSTRDRILAAARDRLARDTAASIADVALEAEVSRATVHRYFRTRAALLATLDLEPDPDTRARVLAAAAELAAREGLGSVSMDELATVAGVSRATVYRLFPGKPVLIEALIGAYTPFDPVIARLAEIGDRPPDEVLPDIARSAAAIASEHLGVLRAIFFEITSGSPDAVEGASRPLRDLLGALGGYLARQMADGRVRPMHPTLAVQSFIGPLLFHLLTRSPAARYGGLDMPYEDAVEHLVAVSLQGLRPSPEGDTSTREG